MSVAEELTLEDIGSATTSDNGATSRKANEKAIVLFSCEAEADDELSMKAGDTVDIISKETTYMGWWKVELNGTIGLVPSNYLQLTELLEKAIVVISYEAKDTEELSVKEGDIINIISKVTKCLDWWKAELNGTIGIVPSNYVKPIDLMEKAIVALSYEAKGTEELSVMEGDIINIISKVTKFMGWWKVELNGSIGILPSSFVQLIDQVELMEKAIALVSYEAQDAEELSLKEGDTINIVSKEAKYTGWWKGERNGSTGILPSNYVQLKGLMEQATVLVSYEAEGTDELSVKEGNIINIISKHTKYVDWWKVEMKGSIGIIPCNYVQLMDQVELTELMEHAVVIDSYESQEAEELTLKEGDIINIISKHTGYVDWWKGELNGSIGIIPSDHIQIMKQAIVLFSYEAEEADELSLMEGDTINIVSNYTTYEGWWKGELNGSVGIFPSNHVQLILVEEDKMEWYPNFGMVSKWHRIDNPQMLNAFCAILKKGDIIQLMLWDNFYVWAVCTQDGYQPKMVHRYGRELFFHQSKCSYDTGTVHEISLDEVDRKSNFHIRINNSRDTLTTPKPIKEIVRCALRSVHSWGNFEFGPFHSDLNSDLDFVEQVRYPKQTLSKRLDVRGCSHWHTEKEMELFSWLLSPGDMVEFNRKNVYSHWAVAVSRPLLRERSEPLVHRYGSGDAVEVVKKLIGTIMRSPFQEVIKGCRFRINNSRDKMYPPKDVEDIWRFALGSIQSNAFGKYNLTNNNCWHFAMQARYRVKVPKNMGLRTEWSLAKDIRPLLSTGDIVEFRDCPSEPIETTEPSDPSYQVQERAIYLERTKSGGLFASKLTTDKTKEVAYLSRSDQPEGKTVVCLTAMVDFFKNVAKGKEFRINNHSDHTWKPKDCKDIVKYVLDSIGKEDANFVVGARYGKKVSEEVRENEDVPLSVA